MADGVDEKTLAAERKYLYFYALMRLRDADLAEDAVQEALVAALQNRETFAGRSSVRTWLVAILRNKIVDIVRDSSREVSLSADEDDGGIEALDALFRKNGHWSADSAPKPWRDPEAALEQQHFWRVLEMCVEALPGRIGEAFVLREVMGESIADICVALGITENNCSVMLFRARARMRGCLEENWFGVSPAR